MKIFFADIKDTILDVKMDRRSEVWSWGNDNAFPSLIETLIEKSVTSKSCVDKVSSAIYGKSFGITGNVVVNSDGQKLNELLRLAAREFTKHNNLFIWVGYDGNFDINSIKVVPTKYVRRGKSDDKGYNGKYIVYSNWDKSEKQRIESKHFKTIDRYNPNKTIIATQIEKAGSIRKYRGQIIHVQQDTNERYSKSDLYPVLSEALLESNSQIFRSIGASTGFLNTKLMVVKPFSNQEDREEFHDHLKDLQGASNSGRVLLLESQTPTDDISKEISLDDLSSKYNDKLFEYSDSQARKNISLAFGVPASLMDISDNSLFGNSGELIREMKLMLWESREEDRDMIESIFSEIAGKMSEPIQELKIINPYIQE